MNTETELTISDVRPEYIKDAIRREQLFRDIEEHQRQYRDFTPRQRALDAVKSMKHITLQDILALCDEPEDGVKFRFQPADWTTGLYLVPRYDGKHLTGFDFEVDRCFDHACGFGQWRCATIDRDSYRCDPRDS